MIFIYLWICTQIIIELLPISSSSHLLLLETLYKRFFSFDIKTYFCDKKIDIQTFYYFLHIPTFLIILFFFYNQWISFVYDGSSIFLKPVIWVFCVDAITCFFYVGLRYSKISFPLLVGFIITGLSLITTIGCGYGKPIMHWNFIDAVFFGLAQSVALLPGISRLAITCSMGCWLGFSLKDSFCLSWLVQAPLMALAIIKSIGDMWSLPKDRQLLNMPIAATMLISSALSWYILQIVVAMAHKNMWYLFGFYMIVPCIIWTKKGGRVCLKYFLKKQ